MEDFTSKVKQAFGGISKDRKFKGSGNRLGTAEESTTKPDARWNARADLQGQGRAGQPGSAPTAASSGPASSSRLLGKPGPPAPSPSRQLGIPPSASRPSTSSAPPPSADLPQDEVDNISHSLALLLSCDNSDLACTTLHKIFSNIVNNPGEPKFRTLRLSNPKVQEAVVANPGGVELLASVGFQLHFEQNQPSDGIASLLPGADLRPLRMAIKYLAGQGVATPPSAGPSTSAPASAPRSTSAAPPASAAGPPTSAGPSASPQAPSLTPPSPSPPASLPTAPVAPTPQSPAQPSPMPTPTPGTTIPPPPDSPMAMDEPSPATVQPQPPTPSMPPATALPNPPQSPPAAPAPTPTAIPDPTPPATKAPPPPTTTSEPLPPPASPPARETKVLMPVQSDTEVPEWFFERTAAEVKRDYLTMTKKREEGKLLLTRAQREAKESAKRPRGPKAASVRVRTPEGVCIQAVFQPQEPLTAVFEWVSASLRWGGVEYELFGPTRKPLGMQGRVGEADLAPAALLNMRVLGGRPRGPEGELPLLRDEMLARAELAWGGGEQ